MREIIIIGTLHAGLTPKQELKKFLEDVKPDQVLVEMAEEDLRKNRIDSYPPEMVYTFKWSRKRNIIVNGFDCSLNTLRKGMTDADNLKAIKDSKRLLKNLSWKDMNKEKNSKILAPINKRLIDPLKERKRNFQMIKNIRKLMIPKGKVVIVTGCSHLNYFEKHIKEANFAFR